jgi:hypothetical protein
VIATREQAIYVALRYLGPGFAPQILDVVDLGVGWRVFYGTRTRDQHGLLDMPARLSVLPLFVGKDSGSVAVESRPTMTGPSAQDSYKTMLKEVIGPQLREWGLRGTGQNYRLPAAHHAATVAFRASRSNTWAVLRFWVHAAVIPRDAGAHPVADHGTVSSTSPIVFGGFGSGRPAGLEWVVCAGAPTDPVARKVVDAVRDEVLVWMRARLPPPDAAG